MWPINKNMPTTKQQKQTQLWNSESRPPPKLQNRPNPRFVRVVCFYGNRKLLIKWLYIKLESAYSKSWKCIVVLSVRIDFGKKVFQNHHRKGYIRRLQLEKWWKRFLGEICIYALLWLWTKLWSALHVTTWWHEVHHKLTCSSSAHGLKRKNWPNEITLLSHSWSVD